MSLFVQIHTGQPFINVNRMHVNTKNVNRIKIYMH